MRGWVGNAAPAPDSLSFSCCPSAGDTSVTPGVASDADEVVVRGAGTWMRAEMRLSRESVVELTCGGRLDSLHSALRHHTLTQYYM